MIRMHKYAKLAINYRSRLYMNAVRVNFLIEPLIDHEMLTGETEHTAHGL